MESQRLTLAPVPPDDRQGVIRYPVPLQGLRVAHLHLPPDLTRGDIDRILAVLWTLIPPPAEVWRFDQEG